jgi:hypothetical protein
LHTKPFLIYLIRLHEVNPAPEEVSVPSGALAVAGLADVEDRAAQIHRYLALSDDDRFMHLSLTRDARHYLQDFDHQTPELLHNDDLAFGAIQIAQEARLQAPSTADTVEASNRVLHQLVDAFWPQ